MLPEEKVIKTVSQISSLINCRSNCLAINYNTLHYFPLIISNYMTIINQTTTVLIFIITYSLGLGLFGRSKIDTQETWDSLWDSLNVPSKSSLLSSDKSLLNYYLLSRILCFSIIFFLVLLRNLKGYEIVARDGGQFILFKDVG